jgi:hypothetical protein
VRIRGAGFGAAATINLILSSTDGERVIGEFNAQADGSFSEAMNLPANLVQSPLAILQARGVGFNGSERVSTASFEVVLQGDIDMDGVANVCDVCPQDFNPAQEDTDGDGIGDACDVCPMDVFNDADTDGLCSHDDPCPLDPTDDGDGDGLCADADNCPDIFNPSQEDEDGDLFGDACDVCPGGPNLACMFSDGFESGDVSAWSSVQSFK